MTAIGHEPSLDHRAAMAAHARRRMWERRRIVLSPRDLEVLCARIRAGAYPLAGHDTFGQPVFRIGCARGAVLAVWSPEHQVIRTFLPPSHQLNLRDGAVV